MLSYLLAGVGLALAGVSAAVLLKRGLNHRAANQMFVKLATSGNVERMRKLCRAAGSKGTYFDAVDAAVAAGLAAKTREPAALTPAVEAAYDAAGRAIAGQWKAHAERGLVGVILVGAGLALAVADEAWSTTLLVLGAAGAAVGAFLMKKRGAMVDALVDGRLLVLPSLVLALGQREPAVATAAPKRVTTDPVPSGALRLRLHRGDTFEREEVVHETVIKIGRNPTAHVRIDGEGIARMHAVIELGEDGAELIDLGSSTGTLVNGEAVTKRTLRSGDIIGIGPYRLEVQLGGAA